MGKGHDPDPRGLVLVNNRKRKSVQNHATYSMRSQRATKRIRLNPLCRSNHQIQKFIPETGDSTVVEVDALLQLALGLRMKLNLFHPVELGVSQKPDLRECLSDYQ